MEYIVMFAVAIALGKLTGKIYMAIYDMQVAHYWKRKR